MRNLLLASCACVLATVPALAQQQSSPPTARASFMNARGQQVGRATLTQTPNGVLIDADVTGLPAGEHGFHLHETGRCDASGGFESAGGHYAPRGNQHGYMVEKGEHAGDMPNQFVQADGVLRAHVLNPHVTLGAGEGTLFDQNGSALMIHSGADDYRSQPSGEASGRIACAVVEQVSAAGAPAGGQQQAGATSAPPPQQGDTMQRADADMRQVLEELQRLGAKPIETLSVEQARQQPSPADAAMAEMRDEGKSAPTGVRTQNMTYPTAGGTQPIRIYTPENAGQGPHPVIVYYHGGGWVLADIDTYEASAMALAKKANAIVASAEYRHAPEHKFPAAHEDAFAAYRWVLGNAGSFGGDPRRVAVAGESAGGNLAANVAIMARDQNVQAPVHMLLVYPVAGTDMSTPSYQENANAVPLSKGAMAYFVDKVLANPDDKNSPKLDLVGKADLRNLPPATVITAEIDPLRSEGVRLAEKLSQAGVETTSETYGGVTHEFFGMGAVVADADRAQDLAARELREAFAGAATGATSPQRR